MEEDRRSLARQLFTQATELLEDAHKIAVAGQRPGIARKVYELEAHRLEKVAGDIAAIAAAAAAIARKRGKSN